MPLANSEMVAKCIAVLYYYAHAHTCPSVKVLFKLLRNMPLSALALKQAHTHTLALTGIGI